MTGCRFITLAITCFLLCSTSIYATSIEWKETTIPMKEAGSKGLETLLVWPDSPGKHPLALISHGSPRDGKQRSKMTAISYLPIAMEFARRSYSVAVVLRRGYGNSGGEWAENYGSCKKANYKNAALASSKDLHAAIQYLSTLPHFDTNRMIAIGVSAGGFATLALTADSPPPGLVAAINFAGGRGSLANNSICHEDALIATFAYFGKTSRVPTLWIYAENDRFFNPDLAKKFINAFKENGGNARLIIAPAYGHDGHLLFSANGISKWTPFVDNYLQEQKLTLVEQPIPLPEVAHIDPPLELSLKNRSAFSNYLNGSPHKAFAVASDGAFGWCTGRRTAEEAKKDALAICKKYTKRACKLYAVDNKQL